MYEYHLYSNLIYIKNFDGKIFKYKLKKHLPDHAISINYWIIDFHNIYKKITKIKEIDSMIIYPAYYFIWNNITQEAAIYSSK